MIDKIKENTLNNIDPILSFKDFIGSQRTQGYSHSLVANEYIPIAESLLENTTFVLTESQKCILAFVKENKLNPHSWHLLKEDEGYYQKVKDWFSENFFKATENVIGGAVDWIKKLGSDLSNAVSSVVSKIMEELKDVWESVKVETNSWYLGNKSLKRQVTMSINQQLDTVSESLNENVEDFMAELTKESSQLSNMFVESVNNIIQGEAFASKVTMSINKMMNESNKPDHLFNASLNSSIMNLVPNAISEGALDINTLSNPNPKRNIRRFNESYAVNEVFDYIESFFKWCINALNSVPPFNWLKEWTNELETKNNLNESLENASAFLTKYFGVPGPYQFEKLNPIYTVIISGLIDFGKYSLVQKLLAMFIFPIPILGPVVSFLLTIYGFFILAQVIFELIEGYNNSEQQDGQPEPAN